MPTNHTVTVQNHTEIDAVIASKLAPNAARAAANTAVAGAPGHSRREFGLSDLRSFTPDEFADWKWDPTRQRSRLTANHVAYLGWRSNSEYVTTVRGVTSAVRKDQKYDITGFSGAALANMMLEGNDCMVIPLYSLSHGPDEPVLFQVRPDIARTVAEYEKDADGKDALDKDGAKIPVLGKNKLPKTRTIKFEAPAGATRGSRVGQLPADIHPLGQKMLAEDPEAVLIWTEGVAKADALLSSALREGLLLVPVALTGVTMGHQAGHADDTGSPSPSLFPETVGEIDHLGRFEILCWDADWRTNRAVARALITFGRLLEQDGATVAVLDTPGVTPDGKGGIDDYLTTKLVTSAPDPLSALLATNLITLADAELITRVRSDDDVGRSERLADELLTNRSHTFDPTTGTWNSYDPRNGIWTDTATGPNVPQIAKELTERDIADPGRYAHGRTASAISNAAILASHDPRVRLRSDHCDLDPYLLNTPSGIVDLRTGELLPHSPAFAMRMVTRPGYDPAAPSPVWDTFLQQTTGDDEYLSYLQRFFGMALIGKPIEEVMAFITGGGRNGKSTFLFAIQSALGSYADTFPAKAFTGDLKDEMLIGLRGVRLAVAAETGAGNALDEQAVKMVTSSDLISGRALYQSRVTFAPSATMALLTNHRPSVRASDEGTWRRMRILPFTNQVTDADKDPDLAMKLAAESAGILRWLVDGCLEFGRYGLGTCAIVTDATAQYRTSQDHLGGFIKEVLITGEKAALMHIGRAELKRLFDTYTLDQGRRTTWTLSSLREGLQERGILPRETIEFEKTLSGYPTWYGIGVQSTNAIVAEERVGF